MRSTRCYRRYTLDDKGLNLPSSDLWSGLALRKSLPGETILVP